MNNKYVRCRCVTLSEGSSFSSIYTLNSKRLEAIFLLHRIPTSNDFLSGGERGRPSFVAAVELGNWGGKMCTRDHSERLTSVPGGREHESRIWRRFITVTTVFPFFEWTVTDFWRERLQTQARGRAVALETAREGEIVSTINRSSRSQTTRYLT